MSRIDLGSTFDHLRKHDALVTDDPVYPISSNKGEFQIDFNVPADPVAVSEYANFVVQSWQAYAASSRAVPLIDAALREAEPESVDQLRAALKDREIYDQKLDRAEEKQQFRSYLIQSRLLLDLLIQEAARVGAGNETRLREYRGEVIENLKSIE